MEMEERSGGCLPGLPRKLGLLTWEIPALAGETLVLAADCAAWLSPPARPHVTACPRQDGDVSAALSALLRESAVKRLRVVLPEVSCCSALETAARKAAGALPVEVVRLPVPEKKEDPVPAAETPPPAPERPDPFPEDGPFLPPERLRLFPAAFSGEPGASSPAVAAVARFPSAEDMRSASALLGRDTVYVRPERDGSLSVRAFSPAGERQPLPGEILAAAGVLRDRERQLGSGTYNVRTRAGYVQINAGEEDLWIECGAGPLRRMLEEDETDALLSALGLAGTEREIRPCLAGAESAILLECPAERLAALSPGNELKEILTGLGAGSVCLFARTGETETALCRTIPALSPGMGAALTGWWLSLLRRGGAECVIRENGREMRTFTGPDGRAFLGGRVSAAERPLPLPVPDPDR